MLGMYVYVYIYIMSYPHSPSISQYITWSIKPPCEYPQIFLGEAVMLRHAAAYGVFDDEETLLQAVSAMMFMYRNDSLEARIDAFGNLMQQHLDPIPSGRVT